MPNGYGDPILYRLDVFYSEAGVRVAAKEDVRIGFRTVALVEDDLPQVGGRTFYVTVNDVPVFLKGSNWIPADVLPEQVTAEYVHRLLTSCKDANMNTLRVWGGGLYESDDFYQVHLPAYTCIRFQGWQIQIPHSVHQTSWFVVFMMQMADRLGIMIWQDFLFACSMYPVRQSFLDTVL